MEQLEPLTLIQFATEVAREPTKIVTFQPTAGFRPFRHLFVKESVKHPAKANLHMIRWIIEKFTKAGDVILDPMAGTYSTCIMASLLNRHSIGVEYEEKFYKMGLENVRQLQQQPNLELTGKIVVLKGDARRLSQVLTKNVDKIVFSPPYATTRIDVTNRQEIQKNAIQSFQKNGYFDFMGKRWTIEEWKKINKGRMDGRGVRHGNVKTYGKNPNNVSNLPYGKVDTIVTSPPYAHQGSVYKGMLSNVKRAYRAGKLTKEQYEHFKGRKAYKEEAAEEQGKSEGQLANLKYGKIDAIVTSPPYTSNQAFHDKKFMIKTAKERSKRLREGKIKGHYASPEAFRKVAENLEERYSDDPQNVGNLKGKTYLSAMLQVYSECYKVLKDNGLMILITKNFHRKKKPIRLDLDTIKLCEHAGFTLIDRWYRKLTKFSFWVILYYKKYGLRIEHEDILVFRKVKK